MSATKDPPAPMPVVARGIGQQPAGPVVPWPPHHFFDSGNAALESTGKYLPVRQSCIRTCSGFCPVTRPASFARLPPSKTPALPLRELNPV